MTKLRFRKTSTTFYAELKAEAEVLLTEPVLQRARRRMKIKCCFYALLFIGLCLNVYNPAVSSRSWLLILNYTALGLSGILLAFNCAHDCVHNTFSSRKATNKLLFYLVFNAQGVNASLWRKGHIASHHIFPNVDGCDADIDDNPFIRLSASQPLRKAQRYQHWYATLLYSLYTLHWILVKDFIYLRKKQLANLGEQRYSAAFIAELILLKAVYFFYMIVLPVWMGGIPFATVLTAFLVMHICISLFFVLTLIISHLSMETVFPVADEQGLLPYDYYEHQLAVSLDYHPCNPLANWIFGGFNSHTAHHLFPHLPHTVYNYLSPSIKKLSAVHGLPYHELSIPKAIASHYRYLKHLSRP